MTKLDSQLWIEDASLRVYGLELGARMTVIALNDGDLLIHSPLKPTKAIISALQSLGSVRYVVGPNKWHHLYIGEFQKTFPDAKYYCAQGLDKKRPDLKFTSLITNEQTFPWNPSLEHVFIEGCPMYNEVVFFHAASKTLLLTDLAVHICKTTSLRTRLWLSLIGSYGKFGWSKLEKFMFIKDQVAFKDSLETIMRWDFARIVLAHGQIVESNAKEIFERAFL